MFLEARNAVRTKTLFLEHKPDVLKQDSPSQKCPESTSYKPQKVLRTSVGRPLGEPERFATA
eukprot:4578506-Pyramimonas_sp.AAC.1